MKTYGKWRHNLPFLTSALVGSEWLQATATFPPEKKKSLYPLVGGSVGPRAALDTLQEKWISCPCRNWTPTDRGVMLTTHLYLVSTSRILENIPPLPNTSSWRGAYLIKQRNKFTFLLHENVLTLWFTLGLWRRNSLHGVRNSYRTILSSIVTDLFVFIHSFITINVALMLPRT
jgi:hypothetical protein